VTVDALPNQQFPAHVLAVAGTATSSSSVVTYTVTFALDHRSASLKPGMTANVDVVVSETDNVLHVPTAAVRGSGTSATVSVLRNGRQISVPVVVGLQGDSATAIVGGALKAGDEVVLPSTSITGATSSGGATTTPGGGGAGGGPPGGFGGGFGGLGG
jgi:macrolide-specific efflux system membrane fusion protein